MAPAPRETTVPVVITIAGSDSGGGAGIQADLKTFASFGVFGTSAVTCVTAQNPREVTWVQPIRPAVVAEQIRAVDRAFPVTAAKTGMLYSAPIVRSVAAALRDCRFRFLVVDPVMVATSGARLLREDAMGALTSRLLPLATVITPNVAEAEVLTGRRIRSLARLRDAARLISDRFGVACVAKGGHLPADRDRARIANVLCEDGELTVLHSPRVAARQTHGTGCTFSAALAACLSRGMGLAAAADAAGAFVSDALRYALRVGEHRPLNPSVWRAGVSLNPPAMRPSRKIP
jgi:hydroxymethylpyrimidine/phosphomethylpyrimidine kinase